MLRPNPVETADPPQCNDVTAYVERLVQSGAPIVLSINGQVELHLRHEYTRQRFVEVLDRLESLEKVHDSLEGMRRGEPARPIDEFFAEFRRDHVSWFDQGQCSTGSGGDRVSI